MDPLGTDPETWPWRDLAALMAPTIQAIQDNCENQSRQLSEHLSPLFESAPPLLKVDGHFVRQGHPPPAQQSASDKLDNAIHPLFAQQNFSGISAAQYSLLEKCVLRLASKLISEPILLTWWGQLLSGYVKRWGPNTAFVLQDSQDNEQAEPNIPAVQEHFSRLAGQVTFSFERGPSTLPLENNIYATTLPSKAMLDYYHQGNEHPPPAQLLQYNEPQIILHYEDHLERLELEHMQPVPWDYKQAGNVENVSFHIIKVLIHQVAHLFFMSRLHELGFRLTMPEPLHSPGDEVFPAGTPDQPPKPDLGYSWEQFVFGTRSLLLFHEWFFIGYQPWDTARQDGHRMSVSNEVILLPNWWVHMWFRKSIWENFETLWTTNELVLPTDVETGGRYSMAIAGEDRERERLTLVLTRDGVQLSQWGTAVNVSRFWGIAEAG